MKIDFIKKYYNGKISVGAIINNTFSLENIDNKLIATLNRQYCIEAGVEPKYETITLKFDYEKLYNKKLDLNLIATLVKKDADADVLYEETHYKQLKPYNIVVDGTCYDINKFDNVSGMLFNSFELMNLSNEVLKILSKDKIFN